MNQKQGYYKIYCTQRRVDCKTPFIAFHVYEDQRKIEEIGQKEKKPLVVKTRAVSESTTMKMTSPIIAR
ncbi:hypothetical protein [Methanolacinia petrolearia]|uniref:hypothetical protein n=1 Tax=Methanolacinia petrolearia TaxID=54120 RepID=UPI003BAD0B05